MSNGRDFVSVDWEAKWPTILVSVNGNQIPSVAREGMFQQAHWREVDVGATSLRKVEGATSYGSVGRAED